MGRLVTYTCDNPACPAMAEGDSIPDGWPSAFVTITMDASSNVIFWNGARGNVAPLGDGFVVACSPACLAPAITARLATGIS